jgi:flagellar basal body-associated protein FliL
MENPMKKSTMISAAVVIVLAIIAVVIVLLVRNNNSSNSLSTSQKTTYTKQIETNWGNFFKASTSLKDREGILQNGTAFAQPIQTEFNAFSTEDSAASISSIVFTTKTAANVVYTIDLGGQPVLKDQAGQALLIDNVWKVSDSTLCQLLNLAGTKTTACPAKS